MFAETGTVTARVRDGEGWEGSGGSRCLEHGAAGVRMRTVFTTLDNVLSYCRGEQLDNVEITGLWASPPARPTCIYCSGSPKGLGRHWGLLCGGR